MIITLTVSVHLNWALGKQKEVGPYELFLGIMPSELGNLTNVWQLGLGTNDLSGTIPSGLGLMTSMKELVLSENALNGELSSKLEIFLNKLNCSQLIALFRELAKRARVVEESREAGNIQEFYKRKFTMSTRFVDWLESSQHFAQLFFWVCLQ